MRVIPFPRIHRDHWLAAVQDTGLSANCKWLAAVCIEELADDAQHVQVSVEQITRRWRMPDKQVSSGQVQTAFKNLRNAGWLVLVEQSEPTRGRRPTPNKYRLAYPQQEARSDRTA